MFPGGEVWLCCSFSSYFSQSQWEVGEFSMNMQRGKAVGTPLDDDRASRECPQTRLRPVAFIWGAARCSLTADRCRSGSVGGQEGGKGGSRGLGGESGSSPDPCRVSRENTGRREARFGNLLGQMIRRVGGDAVRALHARPCKCHWGEPHRGRSRAAWRVVGAPGRCRPEKGMFDPPRAAWRPLPPLRRSLPGPRGMGTGLFS